MQARFLQHNKDRFSAETPELAAVLEALHSSADEAQVVKALEQVEADLLHILSDYNRGQRFGLTPGSALWPHPVLSAVEKRYSPSLLPPPSPCEFVDEQYAWSCWGANTSSAEWLGHGWFWRPRPKDCTELMSNMASSSLYDFDTIEDRFFRLRKASVVLADYDLLRADFAEQLGQLTEQEIDAWLLSNAAVLSAGQVQRISPGGDHHGRLGLDIAEGGVEAFVDTERPVCSGIRIRSGGRAATLFLNDGRYGFDSSDGSLRATLMDVKGLGTHEHSAFAENPKNTGLLNLADALREYALQRLMQRLCELEKESGEWSTVRFYGIIDTGLQYADGQVNPSTGFLNEKCVLLLRQRQSRAFVHYDGYNFSGSLLMTGEEPPAPSLFTGTGRRARRVFSAHGISAEFSPQCLLLSEQDGVDPVCERALDNLNGTWNIQADAALTHLMDFSDYFVLPHATHLRPWAMSTEAVRRSFSLERHAIQSQLLDSPLLLRRLFGTEDPAEAADRMKAIRVELAKDPKIVEGCNGLDDEQAIKPNPPRYCMCWFMELDDSEFSKWAANGGDGHKMRGEELAQHIESWLPTALPSQSASESLRAWLLSDD